MKNFYVLVLFFFIYAIIGWIIEVIYTLFTEKKLINRGFLIGPICPIYGVGGILIYLLLQKYRNDPIVLYVMCILICSIVEYSTSFLMEKIFKNRWWDYSNMKFNINGRICLETMLPFGIGAVLIVYFVNPFLLKVLNGVSTPILSKVTIIICIVALIDMILSFNIIIKLKNISNSLKCDSTEKITKKVKEIIFSKGNIFIKRLVQSFPDMQIYNKMTILKSRLIKDKEKIKQEKKKRKSKK